MAIAWWVIRTLQVGRLAGRATQRMQAMLAASPMALTASHCLDNGHGTLRFAPIIAALRAKGTQSFCHRPCLASAPSSVLAQALGLAWDVRLPTKAQKARMAATEGSGPDGVEANGADTKPSAEDGSVAAGSTKDD